MSIVTVNPIEQQKEGTLMAADGSTPTIEAGQPLVNQQIPVTSDPAGLTQVVAASGVPEAQLPTAAFDKLPTPAP